MCLDVNEKAKAFHLCKVLLSSNLGWYSITAALAECCSPRQTGFQPTASDWKHPGQVRC